MIWLVVWVGLSVVGCVELVLHCYVVLCCGLFCFVVCVPLRCVLLCGVFCNVVCF